MSATQANKQLQQQRIKNSRASQVRFLITRAVCECYAAAANPTAERKTHGTITAVVSQCVSLNEGALTIVNSQIVHKIQYDADKFCNVTVKALINNICEAR